MYIDQVILHTDRVYLIPVCLYLTVYICHLTVTLTAVVQLAHVMCQCHQFTACPHLMTVYVVDDTDYYIIINDTDVDSDFDMGADTGLNLASIMTLMDVNIDVDMTKMVTHGDTGGEACIDTSYGTSIDSSND